MIKRCLLIGGVVAFLVSGNALANADLARANNCMACHSIDNRIIGPAFKDIAKKYTGQTDVEDKLVHKVLKGGPVVWGQIPMPANTQVSDAEAHTLVKWILSMK